MLASAYTFALYAAQPKQYPWYFEQNGVEKCWQQGIRGQGTKVYLIDTEVADVEPLKRKFTQEFHNMNSAEKDNKDKLHGTAMAGLIVAEYRILNEKSNKTKKVIIAGIAPDSFIESHVWKPGGKISEAVLSSAQDIIKINSEGKNIVPSDDDVPGIGISIMNISGGISKKEDSKEEKDQNVFDNENYQLSFDDQVTHLDDIIRNELKTRNTLIIAGVGNDGIEITLSNYKDSGIFPGAFKRQRNKDNILRVAGLLEYDSKTPATLSQKSNYGIDFTDIAAPGLTPVLTEDGTAIEKTFGTSNAAAITSGAVALLKSCSPYASVVELREVILSSASSAETLKGKVDGQRVLNIWQAVQAFCKKKISKKPYDKSIKDDL